ncbi:RluA family pseudouridine synthase [Gottfriedia acidiceleris]|uniref:RluA family pseudouridine synthase n=1 Tax=Bacillaceae TaxID=186817 RepID=UPI000BECCB1D|nr:MULTISPECIES: RluA family pseudouridine synthase [unclassified Bacillus (in: firmicutes)]PEC51583.1 RNA pseudouridine synthase [Bacillus sp. AFS096315]PFM78850.1 RNA pseudouridine synthase [Bacillus sp. AFS077874]
MKQFSLSWEVKKEHNGILLREFLKLKELSKRALTDIKFQGGKITVNGEEKTVRTMLKELDLVQIYFPIEKPSEDLIAEDIPFEIVYEDDAVLVINKPFGIPSIPSREHPNGTLANGLLFYYQTIGLQSTIHIVTRLDKDTSGLMLIAKNRYIHYLFSKNELKNVKRKYLAIVHGEMKNTEGVIRAKIARKSDSIIERIVSEEGQEAITHYKVLLVNKDNSVVELELETGRTHQIRVHMSSIGHPLIGDDLYGGNTDRLKRQALHSYQLSFVHPIDYTEKNFEIALSADLERLLKS